MLAHVNRLAQQELKRNIHVYKYAKWYELEHIPQNSYQNVSSAKPDHRGRDDIARFIERTSMRAS